MKINLKQLLFSYSIGLFLAVHFLHGEMTEDTAVTRQTWEDPKGGCDYGIKKLRGRMVMQTGSYYSGGTGTYVYRKPTGEWICLANNICTINEFFQEEILSERDAKKFILEQMTSFLNSFMHGGDVMDRRQLDEDEWIQGTEKNPPPPKKKRPLDDYILKPVPVFDKNTWLLTFNIRNGRGGVEHWTAKGGVYPLQITSFQQEILAPNGMYPCPKNNNAASPSNISPTRSEK